MKLKLEIVSVVFKIGDSLLSKKIEIVKDLLSKCNQMEIVSLNDSETYERFIRDNESTQYIDKDKWIKTMVEEKPFSEVHLVPRPLSFVKDRIRTYLLGHYRKSLLRFYGNFELEGEWDYFRTFFKDLVGEESKS